MSFNVRTRIAKLKNSAKQRDLHVNLDVNKYQYLIDAGCHFCGDDLKTEKGYCLDRVDSNGGYNIMNLVGCCKVCNRMKSNMNVRDFIDHIVNIAIRTQENLKRINEMKAMGLTEEKFVEIGLKLMEELGKGKPKERIKI